MMALNTQNKSFLELKGEWVKEIAQLDIDLTRLQKNTTLLNKMAEIVVNLQSENQDIKRLAKYECYKINLSQDLTIHKIELIQNQLDNKIEEYDDAVRRREEFIDIFNNSRIKTGGYQIE